MKNFKIIDHPLIDHHLTSLRNSSTSDSEFRKKLECICKLMVFEVTKSLPTRATSIETPLESMKAKTLDCKIVVVSILRAGLAMQNAVLALIPEASAGHLGFYRNEETLQPIQYYSNLPQITEKSIFIICDPMLATGGSLNAALDLLKKNGARNIKCLTLVSAPEGVRSVAGKHPDTEIFTAALDRQLNDRGYILPGLGDAGDRQFGTG